MKSVEQRSFSDSDQFREYAMIAPLLYFHVFEGKPDQRFLDALSGCGDDEALLLLDVAEDQGFLKKTRVTTEITPERRFISKALCELRGLWAWGKGTVIDSVSEPADVGRVIESAHRFAFPKRYG
jgi:hypothetical protein